MRKIDLSWHPGKAKEKSYFTHDNKRKRNFFRVKVMEKLSIYPLNCGSVRLSFRKQRERVFWCCLLCCAKFVQKKTSERNLSNGVTEYHFHVALIAMLCNQTLGCDH